MRALLLLSVAAAAALAAPMVTFTRPAAAHGSLATAPPVFVDTTLAFVPVLENGQAKAVMINPSNTAFNADAKPVAFGSIDQPPQLVNNFSAVFFSRSGHNLSSSLWVLKAGGNDNHTDFPSDVITGIDVDPANQVVYVRLADTGGNNDRLMAIDTTTWATLWTYRSPATHRWSTAPHDDTAPLFYADNADTNIFVTFAGTVKKLTSAGVLVPGWANVNIMDIVAPRIVSVPYRVFNNTETLYAMIVYGQTSRGTFCVLRMSHRDSPAGHAEWFHEWNITDVSDVLDITGGSGFILFNTKGPSTAGVYAHYADNGWNQTHNSPSWFVNRSLSDARSVPAIYDGSAYIQVNSHLQKFDLFSGTESGGRVGICKFGPVWCPVRGMIYCVSGDGTPNQLVAMSTQTQNLSVAWVITLPGVPAFVPQLINNRYLMMVDTGALLMAVDLDSVAPAPPKPKDDAGAAVAIVIVLLLIFVAAGGFIYHKKFGNPCQKGDGSAGARRGNATGEGDYLAGGYSSTA